MQYILILIVLFNTLYSAPARGGQRVLKQIDGVTFIGHPKGDEHLHWIESDDGEILKYNPSSKNYELAEIKENKLAPSGKKYVSGLKKAKGFNKNNLTNSQVLELWKKKREAHRLKMGYGSK